MALTKEEKRDLSKEIGEYMRAGYTKKETETLLITFGYKKSTIDKYWKRIRAFIPEQVPELANLIKILSEGEAKKDEIK